MLLNALLLPPVDSRRKKDDDAPSGSSDSPPTAEWRASFEEACVAARELQVSTNVKLRLYALYKQATVGDAPASAPNGSVLDPAASLKWRSWTGLRGMAPGAAMQQYVQVVAAASGGGGGGDAANSRALEQLSPGKGDSGSDDRDDGGLTLDGIPVEDLDRVMEGFAGPVMSALSLAPEEQAASAEADRRQPLHAAARQADEARSRTLLAQGASVDARDEDEHTALHWACDAGAVEVVRLLLHHGAAADAQNSDGSTPLHMACACEQLEVARCLLEAGASTSVRDEDGCTPAELAPAAMAQALGWS